VRWQLGSRKHKTVSEFMDIMQDESDLACMHMYKTLTLKCKRI